MKTELTQLPIKILKCHIRSLTAETFTTHRMSLTQKWSSSSIWREAEPLVVGCPGCGYWMGHEACLVEGYCQPPPTLHSEKEEMSHNRVNRERNKG